MSPESDNPANVEPEESPDPRDDHEESDDYLDLILDTDERTPEEAGYGHGV